MHKIQSPKTKVKKIENQGDSPALLRAGERERWPAMLTGHRRVHNR